MVAPASLALVYPALLTALLNANYTIFPTEDGTPHLIKIDDTPLTRQQHDTLAVNVQSITFTLFTQNNPASGQRLRLNDDDSIRASDWNANRPTVFITHGWGGDGATSSCTSVRNAYLRSGLDYNVIVMDWRSPAKGLYTIVVRGVPKVATQLARFILYMKSSWNLNTLSTTLVGHSLGAHVVSLGAKGVLESSPIARVVALDPAKPMFQNRGSNCRLDKSHAKYVEVLHTSKFFLGMSTAVGTVDFFANNGLHQPGCSIFGSNSCSHQRAFAYFSESVMKPTHFRAQARNGVIAYMGGPSFNKTARGVFYFKTNNRSPYGRG